MSYYLDKKYIVRLASNPEVARLGSEYCQKGRVLSVKDSEDYPNEIEAKVRGRIDDYTINIGFSPEGLLQSYKCNCKNSVWRGACKHVIAVLLYLYNQSHKNLKRSQSLRLTEKMLRRLERDSYSEINSMLISNGFDNTARVGISASLSLDEDGNPRLGFEIGRGRKYVIKNITDFAGAVTHEETVRYGKELEFEHSIDMFSDSGAAYVRLITKALRFGRPPVSKNERCLTLSPPSLDSFFELALGGAAAQYERIALKLSIEPPAIKFTVMPFEGGLRLSLADETAVILNGYEHDYLLLPHEPALYRLSTEVARVIVPIFGLFSELELRSLIFPESESARFMTLLYPSLKGFDMLDTASQIVYELKEAVAECETKVYFDAEGGRLKCRILFCYGDDEINPLVAAHTETARNAYEEYKLLQILKFYCFLPDETEKCFTLSNDDLIFNFLSEGKGMGALSEHAEVFATDAFKGMSVKKRAKASFGFRLAGDLLEMSIEPEGFDRDELLGILAAYNMKRKYHKLKDGSFVGLDPAKSRELAGSLELLNSMSISSAQLEGDTVYLPKYRALTAGAQHEGVGLTLGEDVEELINRINGGNSDAAAYNIPAGLDSVLRQYQKDGFRWLRKLAEFGFGGILADDMGLGKTLQIIALLLDDTSEKPSIVVAPTSLIHNWDNEITRFAPSITTKIIAGTAVKRKQLLDEPQPKLYITTYDSLKRDIEHYGGFNFRYIVADEAQAIKNPSTQNAAALKLLNGEVRFALTGTPIQNAIIELWSIFDFIMPGYLYDSARFSKHYEHPILKSGDKVRSAELRRHIAPFILRRVKQDVLKELPDKIESTLYADMHDEQLLLYQAYLLKAKTNIEQAISSSEFNKRRIEVLAQLMRLRQICCHPLMFLSDYNGGSGKLDLTIETIRSAIDAKHRILIFSQFTSMLAILRDELKKERISHFYLDGSTDSKERVSMTERFNAGEKKAFLISLKAGGTGLNLTGADVVIHYDPWWNPAVMDQATDRAHRFGQKKAVQVINIVAKNSIEEKILKLQSRKKALIDSVIKEGATYISKMSRDELLEILG